MLLWIVNCRICWFVQESTVKPIKRDCLRCINTAIHFCWSILHSTEQMYMYYKNVGSNAKTCDYGQICLEWPPLERPPCLERPISSLWRFLITIGFHVHWTCLERPHFLDVKGGRSGQVSLYWFALWCMLFCWWEIYWDRWTFPMSCHVRLYNSHVKCEATMANCAFPDWATSYMHD